MRNLTGFKHILLVMTLLLFSTMARAEWELDTTRSKVNFVSIKNNQVGEVHSFASLVGFIGATGKIQLTINLDSVDTLIEVRNERMRELLFETVKFPAAKITAQTDPRVLAEVANGGVLTTDLPITLLLHDKEKTLTVPVVIVGEGDGNLRVFSVQPVLINAADFGLEGGVKALREIAGLEAISNSVPITVQLMFVAVR
jgi:polyisoprenoid-binding protein YceI